MAFYAALTPHASLHLLSPSVVGVGNPTWAQYTLSHIGPQLAPKGEKPNLRGYLGILFSLLILVGL